MRCRVGDTKRMGLFWALVCVMNFAGTIQDSTTAGPGDSTTTHTTSSVTSSTEITMKEATSITTIAATENPTKTTTPAASVSPSGTSGTELPTKEMSTPHTLTTERDTTPPGTDEGATTNTTDFEKNATDNALNLIDMTKTSSEHTDTTEQTTPPAMMQPAVTTEAHSPRSTFSPKTVEDQSPLQPTEKQVEDKLLGEQKTAAIPQSKPQTTLIALITTGLVVAALILCAYFLSNRQSWSPGSRRLDEDYAGNDSPDNTLISVATRDQPGQPDKPNLKAGNQENGTGQAVTPVATNGHSNKQHIVADTEL